MAYGRPEFGAGCFHCPDRVPITFVKSNGRRINLCLECTLKWFPHWTVEDFEARHAPYRDHLGEKLDAALEAQTL